MSDSISSDQKVNLPPPQGDKDQADKYLGKLTTLINQNKIEVNHTDLKKYDLTSLHDHYNIALQDYEVEISHTKQPDTGKDFYVMLFNNVRQVQADGASCLDKLILAYLHLSQEQFHTFKRAADDQIERKRREEEAKRFKEAMSPLDNLLDNFDSNSEETTPNSVDSKPNSPSSLPTLPQQTPPTF